MLGKNILREIRGTWASDQLDMARGLAAVAVLLLHLRDLFFVDYQDLKNPSVGVSAFYVIGNFGHQAVVLFFVLSGYFISATVLRSVTRGDWSWRGYFIQRIARLGVVLIPALLLTALLDHSGMALFGLGHNYEGDGTVYIHDPGIVERLSVSTLAGNVFFLQTIVTPTFGSNSPLWSLSYELWFYVFFPIAVLCIRPGRRWPTFVALPLVAVLVAARHGLAFYFAIWLLGYLAGSLPKLSVVATDRRAKACAWSALAATATILALIWFHRLESVILSDLALGVAFAVFVYAVLQVGQQTSNGRHVRAGRVLAGFSYTLYAIHLPIIFFLRAWLIPNGRWLPTGTHLAYGTLLLLGILAAAYAVSRGTEAKTGAVRDLLARVSGHTRLRRAPATERTPTDAR